MTDGYSAWTGDFTQQCVKRRQARDGGVKIEPRADIIGPQEEPLIYHREVLPISAVFRLRYLQTLMQRVGQRIKDDR